LKNAKRVGRALSQRQFYITGVFD